MTIIIRTSIAQLSQKIEVTFSLFSSLNQ